VSASAVQVLVTLLRLHVPGGSEVDINADAISSLREPAGPDNKLLHQDARCMITMSNGKYHAVIETCDEVRRAMSPDK
jgi:hypothetical protein